MGLIHSESLTLEKVKLNDDQKQILRDTYLKDQIVSGWDFGHLQDIVMSN